MRQIRRTYLMGSLLLVWGFLALSACDSCEEKGKIKPLSLPFQDNFDRPTLGKAWFTERPGRWQIKYDTKSQQGKLCVWQARNMPLFLRKSLPRDVVIEFDAWALHPDGDVKVEIFTDGQFHATGYVLVHGGWNNSWSIIDRLDEHNRNCKYLRHKRRHENNMRVNCRRIKRGGPVQNRRYHWKIVRQGDTVRWYLDGRLHLQYEDPMPLAGRSHKHFAFSNWIARVCFDNLKITAPSQPKAQQRPLTQRATPAPQPAAQQIPTAPAPRTTGTTPAPLQPNIPRASEPVTPQVSRLPMPHAIKLHNPKKPKLQIFRPRLFRPSGVQPQNSPTLYRAPKIRVQPRHP